tara:strand:+ start:390 stop:1172 length:783 start_codon:yes stop_codon:yes gene_type:complete
MEVIVIDNGSDDGTWQMLLDRPEIVTLRGSVDLGFSSANNLAFGHASGDYTLILNPDTIVSVSAISRLLNRLSEDAQIGMIGPKLILSDGSMDSSSARNIPSPLSALLHLTALPKWMPGVTIAKSYHVRDYEDNQPLEVEAISGAFMMIPTQVLRDMNGFDELFWMYGEDLDLACRVREGGWKVVFDPSVEVEHIKRASSGQRWLKANYEFYRSMAIFYRKHLAASKPKFMNVWVYVAIVFFGVLKMLVQCVKRIRFGVN